MEIRVTKFDAKGSVQSFVNPDTTIRTLWLGPKSQFNSWAEKESWKFVLPAKIAQAWPILASQNVRKFYRNSQEDKNVRKFSGTKMPSLFKKMKMWFYCLTGRADFDESFRFWKFRFFLRHFGILTSWKFVAIFGPIFWNLWTSPFSDIYVFKQEYGINVLTFLDVT